MLRLSLLARISVLFAGMLFFSASYAQNSMWICISGKSDIPADYYANQTAPFYPQCAWNQHHASVIKINGNRSFWMCNFENIGAPAGYVVTQVSKVETCGCTHIAKDGSDQPFCMSKKGWPKMSVRKIS